MSGQSVDPSDPRTLVGAFQRLRPDPQDLEDVFVDLPAGAAVFERLLSIYEVAGDPRRPDGMKDAFFIVRSPEAGSPEMLRQHGKTFFQSLGNLAFEQLKDDLANCLQQGPEIRLMEGAAPKHPKAEAEQSDLMRAVTKTGPKVTEGLIEKNDFAAFAQSAIYFLACDAFLRDYVLWPLFAEHSAMEDPFFNYYELWRHGIKIRIFNNKQIDMYVPRHL